MSFRPLLDWILVKLEPLPESSSGGIFLPATTSGQERVRYGTVLKTGPGRPVGKSGAIQPTGVVPGDRVAFFRENLEHQQGKELVRILQQVEEDTGLIRANDILYVVEPGT
jgi:co-chaperonin GroES (HSP10)